MSEAHFQVGEVLVSVSTSPNRTFEKGSIVKVTEAYPLYCEVVIGAVFLEAARAVGCNSYRVFPQELSRISEDLLNEYGKTV